MAKFTFIEVFVGGYYRTLSYRGEAFPQINGEFSKPSRAMRHFQAFANKHSAEIHNVIEVKAENFKEACDYLML